MKRLLSAVIVLALLLCGCSRGEVRNAQYEIGASEQFSEREIRSAMNIVSDLFRRNFDGCCLLSVYYDEAVSQRSAAGWAAQYGADEAIVLLSKFYVGADAEGSLNPDSTYDRYQWVLVRNAGGKWKLKTWGYG